MRWTDASRLHHRDREYGLKGLREALETGNDRHPDVLRATLLQCVHDLQPERRPFGLFDA